MLKIYITYIFMLLKYSKPLQPDDIKKILEPNFNYVMSLYLYRLHISTLFNNILLTPGFFFKELGCNCYNTWIQSLQCRTRTCLSNSVEKSRNKPFTQISIVYCRSCRRERCFTQINCCQMNYIERYVLCYVHFCRLTSVKNRWFYCIKTIWFLCILFL